MITTLLRVARDPLGLLMASLIALVLVMPLLGPVFAALFPQLERPLYELDTFPALAIAHLALVGASSGAAVIIGVPIGIFVTRRVGTEFRGIVSSTVAACQTFPPVAVLAVAVPIMGFGYEPALIALLLYGLLPIVDNTIAGLEAVPDAVRDVARGIGMSESAILCKVELPLAAPVIIAGIRLSVIINLGTAAIASTVGTKTLGLPIIIGLNAANVAYVLQGAVLIGLIAVVLDLGFERLSRMSLRWRAA